MSFTTNLPAPSPTGRELYGRAVELSTLRAALTEASAGRGSLVLISGEAGIGKTTLVESVCDEARALGAIVTSGGCYDLTTTPPFGPWRELFFQGREHLLDIPALQDLFGSRTVSSSQDELFEQVLGSVAVAASRQLVILVLEDQHWADQASLELTRFLARRVRDMPVLIIMTYRDIELGREQPLYRLLPWLVNETRPVRLRLRRLPAESLRELVADRYVLAALDEARLVAYLERYSEGNPFFADELLRALEYERRLQHVSGTWRLEQVDDVPVPPLVRQLIDGRVARLDAPCQQHLRVAAVIGAAVPLAVWSAALDISDEALSATLEQAQAERLVVELPSGDGVRFQHALIREALYESLVLVQRQRWHRKIGEVLEGLPAPDPDAVAYHFEQAADERAARWLIQAGNRAARMYATLAATQRYERARELLEQDLGAQVERGLLLCDLAEAYRYIDAPKALRYLDVAAQVVDRGGDEALAAIVLWCRARIRGFSGENSLDDLRQAMRTFDALSAAARARALAHGQRHIVSLGSISNWFAHFGSYEEALATAERALADMPPAPGAVAESANEAGNAVYTLALAHAALGRPEAARDAFHQARQQLQRVDNDFMIAALLKWELVEVNLRYATDDIAERKRLMQECEQSWSRTRSFAVHVDGRAILPMFELFMLEGEWDWAHEVALLHRDVSALRIDALATLAEIDWRRGERDRAWAHIREALPLGAATEPSSLFYIRTLALQRIAARLAMDDGQFESAHDWITAHQRWLAWSGRLLDRAANSLLWAHYHRGRREHEQASAQARAALQVANEPRQPLAMLRAHRLLGELDVEAGFLDEAADHLATALILATRSELPYERALVLLAQAQLLVARGSNDGVPGMLEEVRQICAPLRAGPVLARVVSLLAELSQSPASSQHRLGLSPRELEVLRLVARGMTDIEVAEQLGIRPRTVSGHLQSIYNKLGIFTRTAAAVIAMEHGLVESGPS